MCSAQEQTLSQVKDSHDSAMHVNEDTVSRRLGASNKTCLYFIIATLVVLLIFALATIMVLVVQRTGAERPPVQKQHSHAPSVTGREFPDQGTSVDSAADPATEGIAKPIRT
ncbi:PREDICTED: tumor necrosis factor ligand superfamily member 8, partial [Fulmarus glacialis]|uniref:tumor necrosis factor ligand superfamily member 8 n=1 Tax=Fulmarus glacialis TaxID=30455 RepID=UPI00051BC3E3